MSIWDDIADLFKSKDELEREKQEAINSAKDSEKDLLSSLDNLEKDYLNSIPAKPEKDYSKLIEEFNKLEKEDNTKTDEELSEEAKKNAYDGYDELLAEINKKFNLDIEKTADKKETIESAGVEKLKELKELFDNNQNKIKNNMIDSGLYNSSIKIGLDDRNSDNFTNNSNMTAEGVKNKLAEIDKSIAELEEKKNGAINEFDIKTAKEYNQKLEKLFEERNIERQKIIAYNENLRLEKQKYDNNREKLINELKEKDAKAEREKAKFDAEQEAINGYSGSKKENYEKRYQLAYDFYNSLPKEVALDVIKSNPSIKGYLGLYYNTLVDSMNNRSDKKSIFNR